MACNKALCNGDNESKSWDSSQLRKYDLNFEQIPRFHYTDPKIDDLIQEHVRIYSICFPNL